MIEEQAVEPRAEQVALEFEYQHADMADGFRTLVRKRGVSGLVYRPAFLVAFGLLGVALLALKVSDGENPVVGVIVVLWAVLMSFAPHLFARASLKANQHQGLIRVTVDADGVRLRGAHADMRTAWANYGSYAESDRVFILRSPDRAGRCAMVLVKRGAADPADIDRLRALLDGHLRRV
ncbi:hypothetical protein [Streptomyces curacoi]|uniref:YcxB-like protein domain-containing protein n=1 Tax=Streptomyces curacoi TaxID=146536 RepID=A0A117PIL8_9ACTN|nr:hypothetical protein [Streptomyces curacoi]KUM80299.1 hypothetical protein AQI70_04295 [Streptomyces curacoi]